MHKDEDTALIRAARGKHAAMVTLLLDLGANIDAADKVHTVFVSIVLSCVVENLFDRNIVLKEKNIKNTIVENGRMEEL